MYNYKEADYKVYVTNDYSIFNHMKENREVKKSRVDAIRSSIDSVGYVRNPIIVNEKMEIIDGQGRFEVLKQMGYPIEFVIDEGIGVDECRAMNVQQTNWTLLDFVYSYCASGDENYLNLRRLIDKYPMFNLATIYSISNGMMVCGGGGSAASHIKSGKIDFSQEKYLKANDTLEYVTKFVDISNMIGGSNSLFFSIIGFIYQNNICDTKRLYEQIERYHSRISPIAVTKQTLRDITEIYNYRTKTNKVYFEIEWDRIRQERMVERGRINIQYANKKKNS